MDLGSDQPLQGSSHNTMNGKQCAAVKENACSATISWINNGLRNSLCLQATILLCLQGEKQKTLL